MKRPNTNINVTFYLKKPLKNSERRGIYANITFRSTQTQIATKIYANHPDYFQRGGLIGHEYHEQNINLIAMKKKLEGYDGHLFNDIDMVLDHYYDGDILNYPSTILEVFEYGISHNKDLMEKTKRRKEVSVNSFERFIKSHTNMYSDFSVIKKSPRQMFRAHSIDYVEWLKNNGLENSSRVAYISGLKSLFN